MTTVKNYIAIRMTEEQWLDSLASRYGGDFCRKVASRTETPPTDADWAEYQEGVELLEKLRENRYYREGGPDEGSEIEQPSPDVQVVYTETESEYAARVRTLNPDDYEPAMHRLFRNVFVNLNDPKEQP